MMDDCSLKFRVLVGLSSALGCLILILFIYCLTVFSYDEEYRKLRKISIENSQADQEECTPCQGTACCWIYCKREHDRLENDEINGTPGTYTTSSQEESTGRELPKSSETKASMSTERKRTEPELENPQEESTGRELPKSSETKESMSTEKKRTEPELEKTQEESTGRELPKSSQRKKSLSTERRGSRGIDKELEMFASNDWGEQLDQNQTQNHEAEKSVVEKENGDPLKRLSALMSNRLRDGNPNVVDLSDQNRPLKVGEQFSELYDNQWTDAFSAMQEQFGDTTTETEIIKILLEIVEQCFEMCRQATDTEMERLKTEVHAMCAKVARNESKLADDLLQRIKEERKLNALGRIPDSKKAIDDLKKNKFFSPHYATCFNIEAVGIYVQVCLKLCHLMVSQDPPMVIESKFDSKKAENFKAYQNRGKHIAYVVWPVLFLHEGGPLVSKGVAEFRN